MAFGSDNIDKIVELLKRIAKQQDPDPLEEGGQFFTTGEARVAAPAASDDFKKLEFPFAARSLIIRHYHVLEVAFLNPNKTSQTVVLEGKGSYEIGGTPPLGATEMWYRTHESASVTNAEFRVEGL